MVVEVCDSTFSNLNFAFLHENTDFHTLSYIQKYATKINHIS
jgi:hypothetical protein